MIQESIQIRRVSEKVKKYLELFGFRHYTVARNNQVSIKAGKRIGGDEIECVISETARGTSVGFYRINSLHGLIYVIPLLGLFILALLSNFSPTEPYISGSKTPLDLDFKKLLIGGADSTFSFFIVLSLVGILIFFGDFLTQELRLSNIKSRFSFFSRDAIWETKEVPNSILSLQTLRTTFTNGYIFGILYFSIFSFGDQTIRFVLSTYRTNLNSLETAIITGYAITCGLVVGILSGDKALNLRRINSTYDSRSRITGGILERRIENISFAIQTSVINSIILLLVLSQTFMMNATVTHSVLFLSFAILGSIIVSFLYQEEPIWITSALAASIFFTTIIFIFRTGGQPGFAFLVFLQLFLIPAPFIYHFGRFHLDILKENKLNTVETLYDLLPIAMVYTIRKEKRRKTATKRAYEDQLSQEYIPAEELQSIRLERSYFEDKSSPAFLLARHYFELLTSYAASFEENKLVLIPSTNQLLDWWGKKSGEPVKEEYRDVLDYIDQLLWDTDVSYDKVKTSKHENVAKKMVISIQ